VPVTGYQAKFDLSDGVNAIVSKSGDEVERKLGGGADKDQACHTPALKHKHNNTPGTPRSSIGSTVRLLL
jgi:hypothetical protein